MTTSKDVLEALSSGGGPRRVLVTLGYSAWGGGQLESEIAGNSWLTVDADANLIFDTPSSSATKARWRCWACRPGAWPRGGSRLMNGAAPAFRQASQFLAFDFGLKRTGVASGTASRAAPRRRAPSMPRATRAGRRSPRG
jgi:hypothetical protein